MLANGLRLTAKLLEEDNKEQMEPVKTGRNGGHDMRLICPNCGAQYEVPDDVIPENGRDVQCSNCSHTWFETPGASLAREEEGDEITHEVSCDEPYDFAPEPAQNPETQDEPDYADEEESGFGEAPPQPQRRTLDPSIAEILREEAEREAAQRRAESAPIESQPDLGLEMAPPPPPVTPEEQRSEEARRRMARLRGEAVPPPSAPHAHRSELLPDIEEINSTLRSTAERSATRPVYDDEPPVAKSGGFGLGFGLVVLVALLGLGVYVFADAVTNAVPALTGTVSAFVDWVDGLRILLDEKARALLSQS